MPVVKVSPKYQVIIPKEVRENSGLKVGSKLEIFNYNGRIEMVLIRPVKGMKGRLSGISTAILRESDRL